MYAGSRFEAGSHLEIREYSMSLKETKLEIDIVVAELRTLRLRSLETRQRRDRPPKLPSRKVLVGIA